MKNSPSLSFIFLAHLLVMVPLLPFTHCRSTVAQSDANSLVRRTCEQTPYYRLCVASLKSVPESSKADVRGLALIMVGIVEAKASTTLALINQELKRRPELKGALRSCASKYDAILTADIPEANEALQKGDPKFAENAANDAAIEADSCEADFHGKSPLTNLNKIVHDTASVAAAIVRQLL